ncbi:M20 family metallopeptidase [Metabacillus iocasae]|uniref:Probable succinyl-diaminopimelate desuccinylase n=1 Tax=Priestia iocasae TaxID=2291674 RepID=A0ABS2QTF1_9BACI|nr:M20 family metallopeptidase [Metabacillus iocasae]MBM7702741.1 succinyl-diaminopimelate desuccinylase [Metabacillus iocasae]
MSNYSEAVLLTQKLIQIPTENPNGSEEKCSSFVESWLRALPNVSVRTQTVEQGRKNVIAKYKGRGLDKPPLVIMAHMDTVPVEGEWSVPPFESIIQDGKLYGRGACDMKSGLACALMTLKVVATKQWQLQRDLYVIATIDEEGPYMKGAMALIAENIIPSNALLIATEPTNLTLATEHKGTIWYEMCVEGKSSHGGNAHLGADAVHAAAEIIVRLKEKVNQLSYNHEIFGKPTISVGTIEGGSKTNMVAGSCRAELDFRLVPPMTKEEANQLVEQAIQEGCECVKGTSGSVRHLGWQRPPLRTSSDSMLRNMFRTAYERVVKEPLEESGFPAYTDVTMIGLETTNHHFVVFGPGHLDQAHATDEFVEIEQIEKCVDILLEVVQK